MAAGDANALHDMFARFQQQNRDFFYVINHDEEGRFQNVLWVDARSKAVFIKFSNVLAFDTTYLLNKYNMPVAPFIGVNHHGQSMLLGCALISNEEETMFRWLFHTWRSSLSNVAPSAIITDQCRSIGNAISHVFPESRHTWCIWHILTKFPDKMKRYTR